MPRPSAPAPGSSARSPTRACLLPVLVKGGAGLALDLLRRSPAAIDTLAEAEGDMPTMTAPCASHGWWRLSTARTVREITCGSRRTQPRDSLKAWPSVRHHVTYALRAAPFCGLSYVL